MKQELANLSKIEGAEKNPFMVELKGKMYLQPRANAIIAKGQAIVDTITGEVLEENVLIGRRKEVDKSQFAKIYASEVGMLFDLSKPAINVFLYLTKVMDYENKSIFRYLKEYDKLGYKNHSPVLKGLRELVTKNIIHPHLVSGIWWINPAIVCKGERFAKYTEYVTKEYAEKARRKLEEDKKEIYKSQNINRRAGYIEAGAYEVTEKEDYAEAAKPRDSNNNVVPKESELPSRYDRVWIEQNWVEQQEQEEQGQQEPTPPAP